MNWQYSRPISVSRDALIAFAWSAPMRELAAKVGISDVGLKKILRSHGIVTPPQGHWNKVHAGKKVQGPPPAAPRGPGESGRVALDERFQGIIEQIEPIPADGPFASAVVPEDLEKLRAYELKAIGRAAVPRNLHKPHRGLIKLLKQEDLKRKKAEEDRWYWRKPVFDTPLSQIFVFTHFQILGDGMILDFSWGWGFGVQGLQGNNVLSTNILTELPSISFFER